MCFQLNAFQRNDKLENEPAVPIHKQQHPTNQLYQHSLAQTISQIMEEKIVHFSINRFY